MLHYLQVQKHPNVRRSILSIVSKASHQLSQLREASYKRLVRARQQLPQEARYCFLQATEHYEKTG